MHCPCVDVYARTITSKYSLPKVDYDMANGLLRKLVSDMDILRIVIWRDAHVHTHIQRDREIGI